MVLNGLDHLADAAPWLKGRRLGLITSTSGVTRMLTSGIDAIHAQFPLTALFGPEHGVRGDHDAGATVETYTDPATRLPVYSLYRKDSQHMTPEMLDLVDTVIYDIQDIGARFYTYISTLLYVMRDCAAAGKELVVLDRINPLGGKVEGGHTREFGYAEVRARGHTELLKDIADNQRHCKKENKLCRVSLR